MNAQFSHVNFIITLTTPTHSELNLLDNFESLEGEEIEKVILIFRDVLTIFFAELSDRSESSTNRALEDYKKKFQKIVKQIIKQQLNETHESDLNSLIKFLTQVESAQVEREKSQSSKTELQYLRFILLFFQHSNKLFDLKYTVF